VKHSSAIPLVLPALLALELLATAQSVGGSTPLFGPPQHATRPPQLELATDRLMTSAQALTMATHAPGDSTRLFVVEQRGVIQILDLGTNLVNGTAFLDIDSLVINGGGERGLLGLAFHPDYQNNGLFYVNYSRTSDGDTVVSEFSVTGDPNIADAGSERILITINQPQSNHNGGWIGFSPLDDYLYIAMGDGGNFCDLGSGHTAGTGNAQDVTANLLGKMLRIDPLGGVPYAIPADNPFVGILGDDEIWSYGLRNPWRCSFDRLTGDLYIGDVGQDAREEVSYQSGGSPGGENYGWRCREGNGCSASAPSSCGATTGCNCPGADPTLTPPIHDYLQNPGGHCTVIGGYVYRGSVLPSKRGDYFFSDLCSNQFWSFRVGDGVKYLFRTWTSKFSPSLDGFSISGTRSFAEDADGELYIITGTAVFKIVPAP
jgi:glucose/arabinose dehydrogenase